MRLPALEKNILKYRALEMALILFQAESLRRLVINSIKATDRLGTLLKGNTQKIPDGSRKPLQRAFEVLVNEGILLQKESEDLQSLIDYRNDIAHKIHLLTGDICHPNNPQKYLNKLETNYRYDALGKLESYRRKIEEGLGSNFIRSLSFDSVYFELAEKTYKDELARLRKRIERQIGLRKYEDKKLAATRQ